MNSLLRQSTYPRQLGLSLVELMISITIGLFLLLGISTLIVQQSSTRSEMDKSGQQIENGRYAMQLLRDDIQLAGYYGEYSPGSGVASAVPDPCTTAAAATTANLGWDAATPLVPVAITGYTASDTTPSCVSNRKSGTAILVVRRTETIPVPVTTADGTSHYLQVSFCNTEVTPFVLAKSGFPLTTRNCATENILRRYIVRIYYISNCNICGTGADTLPTLKMVENGGSPTALVEGIENLQFDYGIDNNFDGAPESYTLAPTTGNWANVVAVRVNLLARNSESTPGYTDPKTYSLGLASSVTPADSFKRHAYSAVVRVVNPSSRREVP